MRGGDAAVPGLPRRSLLGQDAALGVVAMTLSRAGRPSALEGAAARRRRRSRRSPRAVGARSGAHPRRDRPRDPSSPPRFRRDAIFHAIRLEPYLLATARAIPTSRRALRRASSRPRARTKRALVHGDVSPKNILVGPRGPVFLDAECAWWGDPAFDLAFCLNHLLLKCLWTPRGDARASSPASTRSPRPTSPASTGSRATRSKRAPPRCCPALLLARVDGKSPVEYLTDEARQGPRAARRRARCCADPVASTLAARSRDAPGRERAWRA